MSRSRRKIAEPADLPLTREIRSAIADDGRSVYALAQAAGLDESALRRFCSRERSLSLDSAAALVRALGLKLVRSARRRTTGVSRTEDSGLATDD